MSERRSIHAMAVMAGALVASMDSTLKTVGLMRPIETLPSPGQSSRNNPPDGKTYKTNGKREVQRRLRQMAKRSATEKGEQT